VVTLYHQTSRDAARSILKGGFRPGKRGACGGGIYFATTPEGTYRKNTGAGRHRGVILEAKVHVGKVATDTKCVGSMTGEKLWKQHFGSISFDKGTEFVVYSPKQVASVRIYEGPKHGLAAMGALRSLGEVSPEAAAATDSTVSSTPAPEPSLQATGFESGSWGSSSSSSIVTGGGNWGTITTETSSSGGSHSSSSSSSSGGSWKVTNPSHRDWQDLAWDTAWGTIWAQPWNWGHAAESDVVTLYHQTSRDAARSILKGGFRPGKRGACGGGIYFATTPEGTYRKNTGAGRHRGVILEAKVHVGKVATDTKCVGSMTGEKLWKQHFGSISFDKGTEFVVYSPKQVASVRIYEGHSDQ